VASPDELGDKHPQISINPLPLNSDRWTNLVDAYGTATPLKAILAQLTNESCEQFDLWGRLCHQGTIYTASYAALPHLVISQIATVAPSGIIISHIAGIENARLGSRGPNIPDDLCAPYFAAIRAIPNLALNALECSRSDQLLCRAILASLASFTGQALLSEVLLEMSPDRAQNFLEE